MFLICVTLWRIICCRVCKMPSKRPTGLWVGPRILALLNEARASVKFCRFFWQDYKCREKCFSIILPYGAKRCRPLGRPMSWPKVVRSSITKQRLHFIGWKQHIHVLPWLPQKIMKWRRARTPGRQQHKKRGFSSVWQRSSSGPHYSERERDS